MHQIFTVRQRRTDLCLSNPNTIEQFYLKNQPNAVMYSPKMNRKFRNGSKQNYKTRIDKKNPTGFKSKSMFVSAGRHHLVAGGCRQGVKVKYTMWLTMAGVERFSPIFYWNRLEVGRCFPTVHTYVRVPVVALTFVEIRGTVVNIGTGSTNDRSPEVLFRRVYYFLTFQTTVVVMEIVTRRMCFRYTV